MSDVLYKNPPQNDVQRTRIKDVQVKGDQANVDYFQVLRYAVNTPSGERWKSESDDARMKMVKIGQEWKIASGL